MWHLKRSVELYDCPMPLKEELLKETFVGSMSVGSDVDLQIDLQLTVVVLIVKNVVVFEDVLIGYVLAFALSSDCLSLKALIEPSMERLTGCSSDLSSV